MRAIFKRSLSESRISGCGGLASGEISVPRESVSEDVKILPAVTVAVCSSTESVKRPMHFPIRVVAASPSQNESSCGGA